VHVSFVLASLWQDLINLKDYTAAGLAQGGVYALAAIGLVLIYRVSGVLNFAQGAVATVSAFVAYTLVYQAAPSWMPAWIPPLYGLLAAIVTGCVIGFLIEYLTIRPLTGRPQIVKVAVTIGWLLVLQQAAGLIWGFTSYHPPVNIVSQNATFIIPGTRVFIGMNQVLVIVVAAALAIGVGALLRYTTLGASMRAVSDDPHAARLWGIHVDRVTAASWVLGSAMAAVAGVLITPFITFNPFVLTIIVISAFAAALIGRLQSLTLTFVGAIALGVLQSWPGAFGLTGSAWQEAAAFAVMLFALVVIYRPGAPGLRLV
jgi:branched-subunit amino acid ABC-type transport system permease component